MGGIELCLPLPYTYPSLKIKKVETSILETLSYFKDLVTEIENLHSENKQLRNLLESEKNKKESMKCCNCDTLQMEILSKEETFESLVSAIRKMCDTNNISALGSIKELTQSNTETSKENLELNTNNKQNSPRKNIHDGSNESISEIEGTPTGRRSPIIQSKKGKIQLSLKDKTKCPEDWPTPEKKTLKLSFPTPTGSKPSRLKQARLSLVRKKNTNVVDLTCSPEYIERSYSESIMPRNVKMEVLDNDDTILPSPTSGPIKLPMYKSLCKDSPGKTKKLQMAMKLDLEEAPSNNMENKTTKIYHKDVKENLQNISKGINSPSPKGGKSTDNENESMSLLQVRKVDINTQKISPKRPLVENLNMANVPRDGDSSMSILRDYITTGKVTEKPKIEPLYKEPAVRKKAEKRALKGWSCNECRDFYDELYQHDQDMLALKMDECSRHRGSSSVARPSTPAGFWEPRWSVPDDTDDFNRNNNVH